jgi:N-acyl-L-homoserine lactone synthetase
MDRDSHPSPFDTRATRHALLLRRLAQVMEEMRFLDITGPAAFEDLLRRNPTPIVPLR